MEEDLHDESQILRRTFAKLTSKVHQDGFREGVEEGKTRSFQKGFDQGFAHGFQAGFTQACYNGALRSLTRLQSCPAGLEELPAPQKAMCQLCLPSTRQSTSLTDVKAWQTSVLSNSEISGQYRTLNEKLGVEVISVNSS